MNLEQKIMAEMKEAMKARNEVALRGLRAIKAEILKAKTEPGADGQLSADIELKMLQKMIKQRKDSLEIYQQQHRTDLAQKEMEEIEMIERFLPDQISDSELKEQLSKIIKETNASSPADMGKVMGIATRQLASRSDGKSIAAAVKELLAK